MVVYDGYFLCVKKKKFVCGRDFWSNFNLNFEEIKESSLERWPVARLGYMSMTQRRLVVDLSMTIRRNLALILCYNN